jgi:hypothetical protein
MHRLALAGALLASACGSATDDRPPTLDFITETILAPSCATAQCHSAFAREVGDQFDTPAAARRSIVANSLATPSDKDDPASSFLVRTLTVGSPSLLDPSSGNVRMPYDAPMPDADIALIEAWIAAGVPDAQCEPNDQNQGCRLRAITVAGQTMLQYEVVECVDGNIGAVITACAMDEQCTFNSGNGRCVPR